MILDCGHEESTHEKFTTGYGIKFDPVTGVKTTHCYRCCALQDIAFMREKGRITLYFSHDEWKSTITNWPGSLKFTTGTPKRSWHNIAGYRYDYWFVLDGFYWHGYTIGSNTQIAHCRRTKDVWIAAKHCDLVPEHLIQG